MIAAIDWDQLAPLGAFVVGLVLGGIGVIRVTRYVLEYLRSEQRRNDDSSPQDRPG